MQETKTVEQLKSSSSREIANVPDLKIDMFSLRGFELAQRISKAFATSDAVPAIFRSHNVKKTKEGEVWVENPSSFGNCLVAVETAQAVGMSITAVMQNANVIEGKLSWSGKFIIAAVNASRRFTPLRFDIQNKGMITAKYKEKQVWNKEKGGYDFTEKSVEVENLECTAWAYIMESGKATQERIEGAPVSMKMAVEEGWYGKSGSKWQTEMKHLMLQYRAGAYFGNIHAPDVVMGMGRTTEELVDMGTIDVEKQPDGSYAATNLEELRGSVEPNQNKKQKVDAQEVDVKEQAKDTNPEKDTSEVTEQCRFIERAIEQSKTVDDLHLAADLIKDVFDTNLQAGLTYKYKKCLHDRFENPATTPVEEKKPISRRGKSTTSDLKVE
jgi:hypothetical protein